MEAGDISSIAMERAADAGVLSAAAAGGGRRERGGGGSAVRATAQMGCGPTYTTSLSSGRSTSQSSSHASACEVRGERRGQRERARKAATLKANPRQQEWFLKCLQGGRVHPCAACGVAALRYSPPLKTETLAFVETLCVGGGEGMLTARVHRGAASGHHAHRLLRGHREEHRRTAVCRGGEGAQGGGGPAKQPQQRCSRRVVRRHHLSPSEEKGRVRENEREWERDTRRLPSQKCRIYRIPSGCGVVSDSGIVTWHSVASISSRGSV